MIALDFEKGNGLIPCIVQDVENNEVLMLGYMNKESLEETLSSGLATYWSRSRNELWKKGLTSNHYQHVEEILVDCDQDTLLIKVRQDGAACHTGKRSCFYRNLEGEEIR
ncbi:MAG: phosphoribosyl-AMP cyclohydrolase [Erysipelotrichaceae bacterium]|nr:phosphoribosyl-AMP cyclohydrolase [Erysipelotrichaceae bacterium]